MGYKKAVKDIQKMVDQRFLKPYIFCDESIRKTPSNFLRQKSNLIEQKTEKDSFIQVLANFDIDPSSISGDGVFNNKGQECPTPESTFIDCSVNIESNGDITMSKNINRQRCGNSLPISSLPAALAQSPTFLSKNRMYYIVIIMFIILGVYLYLKFILKIKIF